VYIPATSTPGQITIPLAGTFSPGAGTVTLGTFATRGSGSGTLIPQLQRELYAVDLGPT
jgi:hypothetical protein